MRRGALRVIVACAVGALALGGFETVAHGDLLPPLPTTTVTVPVPPLPTSTTVPLPPVTTVTVRPPTTTTVRPPTTSVRLPTTTTVPAPTTSVRLPTTTVPAPTTTTVHVTVPPTTTTAAVRLPSTTSPPPRSTTSTTAQGGGAAPMTTSGGQPPAVSGGAVARANAPSARVRPISGPAIQAVIAGSKPARAKARARAARARTRGAAAALPVLHAARVSAKTPGLAAFYAGLEKALANGTPSVVNGGTSPQLLLPAAGSGGGVLSRTGALMLAVALFILALLLAFALLPRLAAIGFLPVSRTAAQAARESSFVALGAIALCALLAILLLRTAL